MCPIGFSELTISHVVAVTMDDYIIEVIDLFNAIDLLRE